MKPSPLQEKRRRAEEANKVIAAIAAFGHRFFYNADDDRTTRLEVDDRARVWLIDHRRGQRVYVSEIRGTWRGFGNGGTLKALVAELVVYIKDGRPMRRGHFGPWSPSTCGGDLWGYGAEEMAKVRAAVSVLEAVSKPPPPDLNCRCALPAGGAL